MRTFERDVAGQVTKTIDALTNETLTSYRLGGRLASTTFARGPTVSSVTHPLMRATTSTSSDCGLPQGTTFPDATGASSDYLRTTRVDGAQRFPRGAGGRIQQVVCPDGGVKGIQDGLDGQPDVVSLPQGSTLTFEHDAALREVSRVSSDGGVGDRVESMTDSTGTTTYSYDAAGRCSGITYPHGGSVGYTRDVLGRVTLVTVVPKAGDTPLETPCEYEAAGNLEMVTDPFAGETTYVYDVAGRLEIRTLPNGVVTTYGYDSRDRVLSVVPTDPGRVLSSVTYERSDSGEPTKITREDGSRVGVAYDAALRNDTENYFDAQGA